MPQIFPFTFGDDPIYLDETVTVSCTITKGDVPVHIWWTLSNYDDKIEKNLTTNDGVVITRNSQKISVLAIEAVKSRHRGNYTCYASNRAGTFTTSSYLSINGDC